MAFELSDIGLKLYEEAAQPDWGDVYAACTLTPLLCGLYGFAFRDVWDVLSLMHHNELGLLKSPQGWAIIAAHVVTTLTGGPPADPWSPTVH